MAQIPGSLWLWRRPVATVSTGPLTWEPPSAEAMALKDKKKKVSLADGVGTEGPGGVSHGGALQGPRASQP